jgi:hypothetical protein
MNSANTFLNFIGYSNLFLAFCVFCSTWQVELVFHEHSDSAFLFATINFIATFCLYNAQRIFQSFKSNDDERLLWYRKNKYYIFILIVFLILTFSKLILRTLLTYQETAIIYGILVVFSLLYFLPPFEFRKLPFLKGFYIALAWVTANAIIPLLFRGEIYQGITSLQKKHWGYVLSQFFFISAICIPFDIRDMAKDKKSNVESIPILVGLKTSKLIAIFLLSIYLLLAFSMNIKNLFLIRCFVFLVSALGVIFSEQNRHRYFYIYCIDGLIVFQTILLKFFLEELLHGTQ